MSDASLVRIRFLEAARALCAEENAAPGTPCRDEDPFSARAAPALAGLQSGLPAKP